MLPTPGTASRSCPGPLPRQTRYSPYCTAGGTDPTVPPPARLQHSQLPDEPKQPELPTPTRSRPSTRHHGEHDGAPDLRAPELRSENRPDPVTTTGTTPELSARSNQDRRRSRLPDGTARNRGGARRSSGREAMRSTDLHPAAGGPRDETRRDPRRPHHRRSAAFAGGGLRGRRGGEGGKVGGGGGR